MIHPYTEVRFIDGVVGYGVVATQFIPKGTITWVLDPLDYQLTPQKAATLSKFPELHEAIHKFAYEDSNGKIILCWDNGRYVNHSCEPNCLSAGFEQIEIAVRDIDAGEQLTVDYGEYSRHETSSCHCRAQSCRGIIGSPLSITDLTFRKQSLRESVLAFQTVSQPLWSFVLQFPAVLAGLKLQDSQNNSSKLGEERCTV
jgi:uncharacterized protein